MSGLKAGTVRSLSNTLRENKAKTKAYDTRATVTRIVGKTAYVHIPGGVEETPVALTIGAKKGDTVQIHVGGGRAWIIGNHTAPPEDNTKVNQEIADTNTALKTGVGAVAKSQAAVTSDVSAMAVKVAEAVSAATEATAAVAGKANADGDDLIQLINHADGTGKIDSSKVSVSFDGANLTDATGQFLSLTAKDTFSLYTVDAQTETVTDTVVLEIDQGDMNAFEDFETVNIGSFEPNSVVNLNNVNANTCSLITALAARVAVLEQICGVT